MRLLRTVGHLQPRQIAALVAHRTRGLVENPARARGWGVPPFPGCAWQPRKTFLPPLQTQSVDSLRSGHLTFLSQSNALGWPPDWSPPGVSRLWLYNLHYFDWLWSLDFDTALAAALDWIERHPPARKAVGWEPYPISLRLMNWCTLFFDLHRKKLENQPAARDKVWASTYRQGCWLDGHIETHLCGNHVLENAAALCVAGSCFAGADARRWYDRGAGLLRRQLAEQFLADGGHYERSPMYHCRAMYVLLLLDSLGSEEISQRVEGPLKSGLEALKFMCHPDGNVALLNDSAWGIYNAPAELALAGGVSWPPPEGVFALPDTGYYGAREADGSYIICDAGPFGPDHQPGHAHGDTLSFELSLKGHRVIVDSGVHDYEPGEMRAYCRSTRAHNTVEIDGQDQGEFWGTFRVGRRARVSDVRFSQHENTFHLSAAHDGYRRLDGGPRHHRDFRWFGGGHVQVLDSISTRSRNRYVARLHLHPDCTVTKHDKFRAWIAYPGGTFKVEFDSDGELAIADSWFCPRFGQKLGNRVLEFSGEARGMTDVKCSISPED